MALKRIQMEWNMLMKDPPTSYTIYNISEDMFHWHADIKGPDDTPFAGGVFQVDIDFPIDYPFMAPKIIFLTKVFHPNIDKVSGSIYPDIVKEQWTPAGLISKILDSICKLLIEPRLDNPSAPEIARMYRNNRGEYDTIAKSWTQKYAIGSSGRATVGARAAAGPSRLQ